MIVAIQAGDRDKDPAQTRRYMEHLVKEYTGEGDSLLYISQPITMMDQILPVAVDLGLDVASITPDFMQHGTVALGYAMAELSTHAQRFLLLSGSDTIGSMDRDFMSHAAFCGHEVVRRTAQYERIVVT